MKYFKISLLLSAFIIILYVMYQSLTFTVFVFTPNSSIKKNVIINIKPGTAFSRVVDQLEDKGLVKDTKKFKILARIKDIENKVRAGEFIIPSNLTPMQLIHELLHPKEKLYKLTIPEGYNMYQVADVFNNIDFIDKHEFLRLVQDRDFLKSLDFPYETLEGYLYPSTYKISRNTNTKDIIKMFYNKFKNVFNKLRDQYGESKRLDDRSLVIMASVIEKETSKISEMPIIASVFYNRLDRGMKLQSDPTIIYGMWDRYDGNIRKKDLQDKSAYNTYVIKGLPVGPIANPGENSLKAAFKPASSDYIFFVGNNNGEHVFTRTYAEHKKEVYRYQIRRRKRR